ncbi:MAG: ribosome maturation factor RimP [Deltaproteobacteria bacterium]
MANPVQESVVDRVTGLAEPLAASLGLEVVDVEYLREGPRWVLRVFIDKAGGRPEDQAAGKAGGITLEDCSTFSHAFGPLLDVEEIGDTGYALEVSSPGLDRPLKRPRDFERFSGKRAKVRTYAPVRAAAELPERKTFAGTLLGFSDGRIEMDVDGHRCRIPIEQVAKAHLVYELS